MLEGQLLLTRPITIFRVCVVTFLKKMDGEMVRTKAFLLFYYTYGISESLCTLDVLSFFNYLFYFTASLQMMTYIVAIITDISILL